MNVKQTYLYRCNNGIPCGPLSAGHILKLVNAGSLSPTDELQISGTQKWNCILRYREIAAIFEKTERDLLFFSAKDKKTRLLAIQFGHYAPGLVGIICTGITAILALFDPQQEVRIFALESIQQRGNRKLAKMLTALASRYETELPPTESETISEMSRRLMMVIPRQSIPIVRSLINKNPVLLNCEELLATKEISFRLSGEAALEAEMSKLASEFIDDDEVFEINICDIPIRSIHDIHADILDNIGEDCVITHLALDANGLTEQDFNDLDCSGIEDLGLFRWRGTDFPLAVTNLEKLQSLTVTFGTFCMRGSFQTEYDLSLDLNDIDELSANAIQDTNARIHSLAINRCDSLDIEILQSVANLVDLKILNCRVHINKINTKEEFTKKFWLHVEKFTATLEELEISELPLLWMPDDLSKFTALKSISISKSFIQAVSTNLPPHLKNLKLKRNYIRLIDNIKETSGIEKLNLSSNPLEIFPETHSWPKLKKINLSNTYIKQLPQSLLNAKNLEMVGLNSLILDRSILLHNAEDDVDPSFNQQIFSTSPAALEFSTESNLGGVSISNTVFLDQIPPYSISTPDSEANKWCLPIADLARWQKHLVKLFENNLIHRAHIENPRAYEFPDIGSVKIEQISLEGPRLDAIPTGLQKSKITEFILIDTKVRNLPEWFSDLRCELITLERSPIYDLRPLRGMPIQELYLRDMYIQYGGTEIAKFSELHTLQISNTTFEQGLSWISDLKNLRNLTLINCKFHKLPFEIGKLKKLEYLTIRGGSLGRISETIGNCRSLQQLDIQDIPLALLPPAIGDCKSLISIDATGSRLATLPKSITKLKSLRSLKLGRSLQYDLPDSLGEMHWLENLEIDTPQLSNTIITDAFGAWRSDLFPLM